MIISSYTVPWPQSNLLAFLRRGKGEQRFFWESDRAISAFAAFGTAAVLTSSGEDRFGSIKSQAHDLFSRIRVSASADVPAGIISPRLIGGFSFRAPQKDSRKSTSGVWSQFKPGYFVLPKYLLSIVDNSAFLTVNTVGPESDEWAAQEALWGLPAPLDMPVMEDLPEAVLPENLMSDERWHSLVQTATADIRSGQLAKIVLARSLEFPTISNPITALIRLAGRYPDCYRFLFEPAAAHAFFGASPELLVSVSGAEVSTMALPAQSGGASPLKKMSLLVNRSSRLRKNDRSTNL